MKLQTTDYGDAKGKHSLKVEFTATLKEKANKDGVASVKAECKLGDKTLVDKAGMAALDELEAGQSKKFEALPFANSEFEGKPSSCELSYGVGELLGDAVEIDKYCWDGKAAKRGSL